VTTIPSIVDRTMTRPPCHEGRCPMSPERFFRQSKRFQDTWNRVVHAISRMRADGVSLLQAASEFGVPPKEVVRLGSSALRKMPSGRYAAKAKDELLRVLNLPGRKGLREIALDDSREASFVANIGMLLASTSKQAMHQD